MVAIEAHGLTRRYGLLLAVDHVSFTVRSGEIFGFLGPNGAGKSTTVRMLTGYLAPTEGTALLDGHDIVTDGLAARQRLGVVPEEASVYQDLTVWQNVMLMAELYGVPRARRTRHGSELLVVFGLDARRADKGRSLSKGLRQRLMLCMALGASTSGGRTPARSTATGDSGIPTSQSGGSSLDTHRSSSTGRGIIQSIPLTAWKSSLETCPSSIPCGRRLSRVSSGRTSRASTAGSLDVPLATSTSPLRTSVRVVSFIGPRGKPPSAGLTCGCWCLETAIPLSSAG
ncbi:MAG TPA: ABC transporter ATP-binding protein [Methylomirabilota bacterium]